MQWLKKHRGWVLAVVAVLVLGLGAWAFRPLGGDQQLAKIKELEKQLRGQEARDLDPEQRRELWQQLREQMKELTPEQHQVLWKEKEQAMAKKISDFFALAPDDQEAYLDDQIDRMEEGRKRWQERQPDGNTGGSRPGGMGGGKGGFGGGFGGKGGWGGKKGGDSAAAESPTTSGDGGAIASSGKGKGWSSDPQTREQRRKQRLDETTAEQRAQFSEYFRLLNERRKQRDLPTFGPGRR